MDLNVIKAEKIIRMFAMELSLAQQTAYDLYFSRDPHVIWHCFQPFLGTRSLQDVRVGMAKELIPNVAVRPAWIHLLPMLEDLYRIMNLLDDEPSYRCTLCRGR
jgi:hypothetical protein